MTGILWRDQEGTVLDTMRMGHTDAGIMEQEGVAPQQGPDNLV